MSGIIIVKVAGRVAKEVVTRLRNISKKFAEDDIAMLIQSDKSWAAPYISLEITALGYIDRNHVFDIIDYLFICQKGKGIGNTEVTLSFKDQRFVLHSEYKSCMNFLS